MPELKHTFTGGKMEKDKDERIVPNGQYREALNISVATSEGSDVGAAQNILGNIKVTSAIRGRTQTANNSSGLVNAEYSGTNANSHVAEIVDPETDMLYRFINTQSPSEGLWMDRIVEYDTSKSLDVSWQIKEAAVMVDIYKVQCNVTYNQPFCVGGNRMKIRVDKNLNQLRWGMRITAPGIPFPDATIESIDYSTQDITIDKVWPVIGGSFSATFSGDRNLNFSPDRIITGVNILDGMLFWTDNYSEPKKIEIKRGKMGSDTSLWVSTTGLIGRYTSNPPPKIDDFNQHTILIVEDLPQYDLYKNENVCPVQGCTNPLAYNYAPLATMDDGNCCLVSGCLDVSACNYDPSACEDDGLCCYSPPGCTDPAYEEYDDEDPACCDDGSCSVLITFGCLWGYQTDNCSDTVNMVQVVGNDIYSSDNQFEMFNSSTGLFDLEMMVDSVLQWYSLNATGDHIESRWFMSRCTGCSYGGSNGWQSDGQCSYEGNEGVLVYGFYPTFTLEKKKFGPWKFSDPVVQDPLETADPILGNSSGLSIESQVCFSQAGCANTPPIPPGFDSIDSIIAFLRDSSVFDGTFSSYDSMGSPILIPEVTYGMSWNDIKIITETTYSFIPPSGDGPVHLGNWQFTHFNCLCDDYYSTPTCVQGVDSSDSITGGLYPDSGVCGDYCPPANWVSPLDQTTGVGDGGILLEAPGSNVGDAAFDPGGGGVGGYIPAGGIPDDPSGGA